MKKLVLTSFALFAAVLFVVALGMESSAEKTPKKADPYKLVAPLDVVMEVGEDIFYDIDEKLLKAKKFKTIRKHSLFLAELSNITKHVEEIDPAGKKKEWMTFAQKNIDGFLAMAKASKAKNAGEVKALFGKVEETCDACHEIFQEE